MGNQAVGRPMEVLLVEDNLVDARTTIEALAPGTIRCRVTLVCDGEEALAFLRRAGIFARAPRPDVVLLDMELPKKDGRQVLTEIRGDEGLHALPVIVLTASLVHRAVLEAQHLHVDQYMTKPVSLDQFIAAVKSLRQASLVEMVLAGIE